MFWRYLFLFLIIIFSTSCSETRTAEKTAGESAMQSRQEAKYLAYEHSLIVDVKEESLSHTYKSTLDACIDDKENNCTILDSRISAGTNPYASIRLRIKPEGVKGITAIASSKLKGSNLRLTVDEDSDTFSLCLGH